MDKGERLAHLIINRSEVAEQKRKADAGYNRQIQEIDRQIETLARNINQTELPLDGEE